ncbi:MAG TPA: outer membrane lipoprotein carrier protein LolA [Acidobacteriota bacterium]
MPILILLAFLNAEADATALAKADATDLAGADATDLVRRVQARYDRLRDLRAEFVQRQLNRALGSPIEERGLVYMKRPNQMRWEYRAPERKLFVSDGERAWWYLPEENQVQVLRPDLSQAPTLLLGGTPLLQQYQASWAESERPRRDGNRMVRLQARPQPTGPAARGAERDPAQADPPDYPTCWLEIDPARATIERLLLEDAVGNRAEYRLEHIVENPGLDPALFRFTPPAGVDLVELP